MSESYSLLYAQKYFKMQFYNKIVYLFIEIIYDNYIIMYSAKFIIAEKYEKIIFK
jgi:hypothetical protein